MKKVIFILLDGLTLNGAKENMGYLSHLVEKNIASFTEIKGELPSLSRPCYQTILTGQPAYKHGITANNINKISNLNSIFSLVRENNLKTAAAAYYWISELYNESPFNPVKSRITHSELLPIQYGLFYFDDAYPDSHLFLDGEFLRQRFNPDFTFIHPMGLDYIGHKFGSDSSEYENALINMDSIIANLLPTWISEDYVIFITSDHGMTEKGSHGGDKDILRKLPLYGINIKFEKSLYSQLQIAPTLCEVLGIAIPETMENKAINFSLKNKN